MNTYTMVFLALMLPSGSVAPRDSFLQYHSADLTWAGAYQLNAGRYRIAFSAHDGRYALPVIHLIILKAAREAGDSIIELQPEAQRLLATNPIVAPGGKGILIRPGNVLYRLPMDSGRAYTEYAIAIERDGLYILFLETNPSTLSAGRPFMSDRNNGAITPKTEWAK